MFYSYASLSGPNSRFHLIWSAATYRRKKLTRREALSVSIQDTCTNLVQYIPCGNGNRQMKTKFSLYLLAQLLYGTIVIYREQIKYLTNDLDEVAIKLRYRPTIITGIDLPENRRADDDVTMEEMAPIRKGRRLDGRPRLLDDLNLAFDDFNDYSSQLQVEANVFEADRQALSLIADISERHDLYDRYALEDELMPVEQEQMEEDARWFAEIADNQQNANEVMDEGVIVTTPIQQSSIIVDERPMMIEQQLHKSVERDIDQYSFILDELNDNIVESIVRHTRRRGKRTAVFMDEHTEIQERAIKHAIQHYGDTLLTGRGRMIDMDNVNRQSVETLITGNRPSYKLAKELYELYDELVEMRKIRAITAAEAWQHEESMMNGIDRTSDSIALRNEQQQQLDESLRLSLLPVERQRGATSNATNISFAVRGGDDDELLGEGVGIFETTDNYGDEQQRSETVGLDIDDGEHLSKRRKISECITPTYLDRIDENNMLSASPMQQMGEMVSQTMSKTVIISRDEFMREIKSHIDEHEDGLVTFEELTVDVDRAMAAKKFYMLLSLSRHQLVRVEQSEAYGAITISLH